MSKVIADIKKGFRKTFINAICNHNNELVLEYLKNGMRLLKNAWAKNLCFMQ